MHRSIETDLDVGMACGVPGAALRATVWLPDELASPAVVCVALPGGGYNRRYWSLELPREGGDGEAGYHLDRGWIVIALDHLGVGDSTIPDRPTSLEEIAAANNAAVQELAERLRQGSLAGDFAPVPDFSLLGLGQSMGGQFLLVLQAHHSPFEGIGILGYSAIHTIVPSRPGNPPIPFPWIVRSTVGEAAVVVNAERLGGELSLAEGAGGHPLQWAFHFDDEPPDLVAADMAPTPLAPWRSATAPACAVLGVAPGVVATEAAGITVPVFVGLGERDVVPNPWLEPFAYRSASDITLFVCERMAHMHNFASTRRKLWQRLHHWGNGVALGRTG